MRLFAFPFCIKQQKGTHVYANASSNMQACMYRSLPGYEPKAQCDRTFVLQKTKPLQLDASLSHDVFSAQVCGAPQCCGPVY
jgi:hypothetical protein